MCSRLVVASVCGPNTIRRKLRSTELAKAKTPRNPKPKSENRVLQMPGNGATGNGFTADLESEIRLRAYELYEQRGRISGTEEQDWLDAEREVRARHAQQTQTA